MEELKRSLFLLCVCVHRNNTLLVVFSGFEDYLLFFSFHLYDLCDLGVISIYYVSNWNKKLFLYQTQMAWPYKSASVLFSYKTDRHCMQMTKAGPCTYKNEVLKVWPPDSLHPKHPGLHATYAASGASTWYSSHLLRTYYVPVTVLSALQLLTHFICTNPKIYT